MTDLDQLAASNTAVAAAFAADTNLNLDGVPTPTGQLPEAVLMSQGAPESMQLLRDLRSALAAVADAGLDEDRIMEFASWALFDHDLHGAHGSPPNAGWCREERLEGKEVRSEGEL